MGVGALWKLLKEEGLVEEKGFDELKDMMDGAIAAVDISGWIVQAGSIQALQQKNATARTVARVCFEKAAQLLHFGCVPVGILDGQPPAEKGRQARGIAELGRLGRHVRNVFEAMGLPVIDAEGEGEALSAALVERGLVDVALTEDGDGLVFGGEVVCRKLRLDNRSPSRCGAEVARLEGIRKRLGIERGGEQALACVASLSRSDYDNRGCAHVGPRRALALVCHLLEGRRDDSGLIDDLESALLRSPDQEVLRIQRRGCTGCKRCRHEGHGSKRGCDSCATEPPEACWDRQQAACECAFHMRSTERLLARVQTQIVGGELARPSLSAARTYVAGWTDAAKRAEALSPHCFYARRPDVNALHDAFRCAGLDWALPSVQGKAAALVVAHDATHRQDKAAIFTPAAIRRARRTKAAGLWEYVVDWKPPLAEAWPERAPSDEDVSVRAALLERHWPELCDAFRNTTAKKKKHEKPVKSRAGNSSNSKRITEAFSVQKGSNGTRSASTKPSTAAKLNEEAPALRACDTVGAVPLGRNQPENGNESASTTKGAAAREDATEVIDLTQEPLVEESGSPDVQVIGEIAPERSSVSSPLGKRGDHRYRQNTSEQQVASPYKASKGIGTDSKSPRSHVTASHSQLSSLACPAEAHAGRRAQHRLENFFS